MVFEGGRELAENHVRSQAGSYYVYLLCRPDGRPFYVGKGMNRRIFEHEMEARRHHPLGESNPFKCNVIRKIIRDGGEILYRIDSQFSSTNEGDALKREAELIRTLRRLHEGGCLTNLAGGLGNLSGAAPHSIEKHAATLAGLPADNPERATLNQFLLSIGPVRSVPVKPLNQLSRILPTTPHPNARSPSQRCGYALLASGIAHGLSFEVDEVLVPRSFVYEGVEAIIENGVARDILKAQMAHLVPHRDPSLEKFRLSRAQIESLVDLLGEELMRNHGLV